MFGFPRDPDARRPVAPLGRVEPLEDRITPVINLNADVYSAALGQVLTVPATKGVLANDFSDVSPGQVLSAALVTPPRYVGSNIPLPGTPGLGKTTTSLFLNPDGSFTFIAPSPGQVPAGVTQVQFTYTATNAQNETTTGPATVTINLQAQSQNLIAVGADAPGGPHVRVYESGTGVLRHNFFPYEPTFTGGVRVAVGDLNQDGVDDIVTIPATGGAPRVRIFDGSDGLSLYDQFAFDPNFRGGGYVAVGDFNGDTFNDVIVGAGEGGGPRVQVFSFKGNFAVAPVTIADFFAFDPGAGQFGVRVAAGDLESRGRDQIVAAAGNGGGPEVRVFDAQQVIPRPTPGAAPAVRAFFVGDTGGRSGVFIGVGDFTGSGQQDIVTGSGSGTPVVRIYSGRTGAQIREFAIPAEGTALTGSTSGPSLFPSQSPPSGTLLSPGAVPGSLVLATVGTGFTGGTTAAGGARVATTDYNGDGVDEIVVGAGPGSPPRVRIINTVTGGELINLVAFSGTFLGGVNVAGG